MEQRRTRKKISENREFQMVYLAGDRNYLGSL